MALPTPDHHPDFRDSITDDGQVVRREQYERLAQHLRSDGRPYIEMSFAEVSALIGAALPDSAAKYSQWWEADPQHTQAAWLEAGYRALPNRATQRVTFVKTLSG
jgi:hypothetical protein